MAPERARAPDARLDLVHDEERAELPARLLRAAPVLPGRLVHALALDGLGDEGGYVTGGERVAQRGEVAEGDLGDVGEQGAEALSERGAAVERERAQREPVVRVGAVHDPGAPRERSRELDRGLDGLGPRVAEVDALELRAAARAEGLGEEPWEQGRVHLDHVRQVEVDRLVQRRLDGGVRAAEREHPEAAQQVEVPLAVVVVEPWALAAHVGAVEAQGPKDPRQLGVEVRLVQRELLALVCTERGVDVEGQPDLLVERA